MKLPIVWMLLGTLSLVACGTPRTFPQAAGIPETVQTIVTPADQISPVTPQISPSPTSTTDVAAYQTTQMSPLPTPTLVETQTTLPARTATNAPTEAEGQVPSKLTTALGEPAIIYRRSGGFAGISEQWTIYPNGRIEASNGRTYHTTAEQVEQVLREIAALGFFEMSGRYMSRTICCDRFTYEITVRRDSKVNSVTTIDAEPDAPPELWQVIDVLNHLVSAAQTG